MQIIQGSEIFEIGGQKNKQKQTFQSAFV